MNVVNRGKKTPYVEDPEERKSGSGVNRGGKIEKGFPSASFKGAKRRGDLRGGAGGLPRMSIGVSPANDHSEWLPSLVP